QSLKQPLATPREAKALQCYAPPEAPAVLALKGARRGSKNFTMPGMRRRPPDAKACARHCLPSVMLGVSTPLSSTKCVTRKGVQTANNKQIPFQLGKGASNPK
ncbi:hypothetical protein HAX54_011654, partial [Datura stramonium]|nr:hypothetical protein [Datura stramonium]